MLVAALAAILNEWRRRRDQFGLSCSEPQVPGRCSTRPSGWITVKLNTSLAERIVAKVRKLPQGKRNLEMTMCLRSFGFRTACPTDRRNSFAPRSSLGDGTNVKLRTVTIEIAPNAPVLTSLDIQAPWLDEMRNDKKNGSRSCNDDSYLGKL